MSESYYFYHVEILTYPSIGGNYNNPIKVEWGEGISTSSLAGLTVRVTLVEEYRGDFQDRISTDYTLSELLNNSNFSIYLDNGCDMNKIDKSGMTYLQIRYDDGTEIASGENFLVLDIGNPILKSLTISNFPTQSFVGRTLDTSGIKVTGNYSNKNGSVWTTGDITSFTCSIENGYKFTQSDMGIKTITITTGSVSATFDMTIYGLKGLKTVNAPDDIKAGNLFSWGNMEVRAVFTDGSSFVCTDSVTKTIDVPVGTVLAKGEYPYTLTYKDVENGTNQQTKLTGKIHVYGLDRIETSAKTTKLKFNVGDNFTFGNNTLTAIFSGYADGVERTVDLLPEECVFSHPLNTPFTKDDMGDKLIKITYTDLVEEQPKSITIGVTIKGLQSIAHNSNVELFVNDTLPTTMSVEAKYSDGTTAAVDATVSNASDIDMTTAGSKTLNLSYTENGITQTCTASIEVKNVTVVEILDLIIPTSFKTTYKVGDKFSNKGLQCKVSLSNGQENTTEITSTNSSIADGYEFLTKDTGNVGITISVGGQTKTFANKFNVIKLVSISLNDASITKEYIQDATLNLSGLTINKTYSDDHVEENADFTSSNPTNGSILKTGGTNTITIYCKEGDIECSASFNIEVKAIQSIEIRNQQVLFDYGAAFTLGTNAEVVAHFVGTHFAEEILQPGDYTLSTEIGTPVNVKTPLNITIRHDKFSVSYVINTKYLFDIELANQVTSFYKGDAFNLGDTFQVTAVYKYSDADMPNTTKVLKRADYTTTFNNTNILSNHGDFENLVVYIENGIKVSKAYTFNVIDVVCTQLTLDTTQLTDAEGELTFYQNYTTFGVSGKIKVTATYNNGDTKIIPISQCLVEPRTGHVFNKLGENSISITYESQTASYIVNVLEHKITALELNTNGVTKEFLVGDKFEKDYLEVYAVYNSGYKEIVSDGLEGYTISPKVNEVFTEVGSQKEITISYKIFTATYTVNVAYPMGVSLDIDGTLVNQQPKNGDIFNPAALKVTMVCENGYRVELTYTAQTVPAIGEFSVDCTALNLSNDNKIQLNDFGNKELIVTGASPVLAQNVLTKKFIINILPNKQLQQMWLDTTHAKTEYKTGDKFTGEGLIIKARFLDTEGVESIPVVDTNTAITTKPALGSIIYKAGTIDVELTYTYLGKSLTETTTIYVVPSYSKSQTKHKRLKVVKLNELSYAEIPNIQKNADGKVWALFDINDTEIDDTDKIRKLKPNIEATCYGYVLSGSRTTDSDITINPAKVVLFKDYKAPMTGDSNITVTFRRTVKGAADKINLCRDIVLYGYNNARNRAFVSQNPSKGMENIDYHSDPINVSQTENYVGIASGDLTYFPDTGYCAYGQNSNSIKSTCILNNGLLLVLKSDSKQEPTIYFRKAKLTQAITADGAIIFDQQGKPLYEESFPLEAGNIGDGALSKFGIINFYGDTVYLTKKGLKGIDYGNALADNSKFANPRSSLIDKALVKEANQDSFLYAYREFLLLATKDKIYVANENYRSKREFEWWIINNVKAKLFFEYDEELYFATEDGRLCKFNFEDTYKDYNDKSRVYIGFGGVLPLALDQVKDELQFNYSKYKDVVKNGNRITITSDTWEFGVFAKLGKFVNKETLINNALDRSLYQGYIDREKDYIVVDCGEAVEENGYTATQNKNKLFYDGRVVYIDELTQIIDTSKNSIGVPYTIVTKDEQGNDLPPYCFKLKRNNGEYADLDNLEALRISFMVEDTAIIADTKLDEAKKEVTCKLLGDHDEYLDLIQYANQKTDTFKAIITEITSVKAKYITKPFNFGQPTRYKDILSWLVVNDTNMASYTDLGYIIDNLNNLESLNIINNAQSGATQFDLGNMNFDSFTFEVGGMPKSYKSERELEDVEFISFVFINDKDTNMIMNNLAITYTLTVDID